MTIIIIGIIIMVKHDNSSIKIMMVMIMVDDHGSDDHG